MSSSSVVDIDSNHEEEPTNTLTRKEREREIKTKLKEIIDLVHVPNGEDGECGSWDSWNKDKDEHGCCHCLFFCVLPIVLIVLIVKAVKLHDERGPGDLISLNGWPVQCFPGLSDSVLLPADDLTASCDEQVKAVCQEQFNQLNTSVESVLEFQSCVSENWFEFSPECQAVLDHERLRPLFPSSLEQRFLVNNVVQLCEDSIDDIVEDDCERFVHHFDEDNLCQVYDASLCLLYHSSEIEPRCKEGIDKLGLSLPQDYDPRTYLTQQRSTNKWYDHAYYSRNKYAKSAAILGTVWASILLCCCCCGCCCGGPPKGSFKGKHGKGSQGKFSKFMNSKNPKSDQFMATATPV